MLYAVIAIQILVLLFSIGLWSTFFSGRLGDSESLWPSRAHPLPPHGLIDIIGVVFVWLVLQTMAALIGLPLLGVSLAEAADMADMGPEKVLKFGAFAMGAQMLVTFGGIVWLLLRFRKVEWLGRRSLFARDLKVGLVAAAMIIPVTFLVQLVVIQLIPYEHPTLDSMKEVSGLTAIACAWFAAVIGAPITEEFFFRGLLQGFMQRLVDVREGFDRTFIGGHVADPGSVQNLDHTASVTEASALQSEIPSNAEDPWASVPGHEPHVGSQGEPEQWRFWLPVVASSILFAAAHIGQGPAPIPLFFLSLGIGYVFRKTGSILPCVVIHMTLNGLSMGMLMLQIWYPDAFPPEATTPS